MADLCLYKYLDSFQDLSLGSKLKEEMALMPSRVFLKKKTKSNETWCNLGTSWIVMVFNKSTGIMFTAVNSKLKVELQSPVNIIPEQGFKIIIC